MRVDPEVFIEQQLALEGLSEIYPCKKVCVILKKYLKEISLRYTQCLGQKDSGQISAL
jgi:hypothetical protein